MNKKVLELFAEEIKNNVPYYENQQMVADVVIDVAKKSNSKFNEKKFLRACGLLFDSE
jgi:stage III sporulation protein SpoIIIAA